MTHITAHGDYYRHPDMKYIIILYQKWWHVDKCFQGDKMMCVPHIHALSVLNSFDTAYYVVGISQFGTVLH